MSLVDPKPPDPEKAAQTAPRIVALLNQKGGVGKTTSTVNLGAALARLGRRVLLVDLDPQSNLSLHFGVEPAAEQPSAHALLLKPEVSVHDVRMQARPGLDFIPSVTELALIESELAQRPDMQHVLRKKLEQVYAEYDIVLLDCPPSLGVLSVNALTVADEVFVPMQAHYLPLRGLEKLLQTVHMVSQGLNPEIRVTGILLCMHEGNSSHARAVIQEITSQLEQYRGTGLPWEGAALLAPPVRRNIKLAEAPSFGMTIFDYAPRCPGADDYRQLAQGLLERWGMPVPEFDWFRPRKRRESADRGASEPKRRRGRARTAAARKARGGAGKQATSRARAGAGKRAHKGAGKGAGKPAGKRAARRAASRVSGRAGKHAVKRAMKRAAKHAALRSPVRSKAKGIGKSSIRSGGLSL